MTTLIERLEAAETERDMLLERGAQNFTRAYKKIDALKAENKRLRGRRRIS